MMIQREELTEVDQPRGQRVLDRLVGLRGFAAAGAMVAAVAPAVMATSEGDTLRGSVSAYYDIEPAYYFWGPFTAAGLLLAADGAVSYLSANRGRFGRRWYNIVIGVSLLLLTWYDIDESSEIHKPAAVLFFSMFIAVIGYTSALGIWGRPVSSASSDLEFDRPLDRVLGEVSFVFLGLLAVTLGAWSVGLISFFFFEVFALVNFALYYVQGLVNPFPYNSREFTNEALNRALRLIRIMSRP